MMMQAEEGPGGDAEDREREFIQLLTNAPPDAVRAAVRVLVAAQPDKWIVHEHGIIIAASTAAGRAAGYACGDDLVNRNVADLLPPPLRAVCLARAESCAECAYHLAWCDNGHGSLYEIQPHMLRVGNHLLRLLHVVPVARLAGVEWVAPVAVTGGGISARVSVNA